jgi:hypothetical protein
MSSFVRFAFLYFIFAIVATTIIYDFTLGHLSFILAFSFGMVRFMGAGPWVLWLTPVIIFMAWKHPARIAEALYAFVASLALICGYTLLKVTIPVLVPFWADGMLSGWDLSLHGGVAPWELTHRLSAYIDTDGAARTYSGLWGAFAFSFPAFLALGDSDAVRKTRFLALYAAAWVLLGNGVATVFSSVGPIYMDRMYGGAQFAPMISSLADLTFPGTSVDALQRGLWAGLEANGGSASGSSGISAFPSMHVAMASVWAVYITERSKLFAPVAIAFAAMILFLSVYTGWHYAVDGYASVCGVLMISAFLRFYSGVKLRKRNETALLN